MPLVDVDERAVTASGPQTPAVIAFAGRRPDAPDAQTARFPPSSEPRVRGELAEVMWQERTRAVIGSAACGADLIALDEAGRLGLQRHVVLPFAPERFRLTSVIDRPGDWGALFDRVVAEVERAGGLVVLGLGEDDAAYAATNAAILRQAQRLAETDASRRLAVVVWEGAARSGADFTDMFRQEADTAGFDVRTVRTD